MDRIRQPSYHKHFIEVIYIETLAKLTSPKAAAPSYRGDVEQVSNMHMHLFGTHTHPLADRSRKQTLEEVAVHMGLAGNLELLLEPLEEEEEDKEAAVAEVEAPAAAHMGSHKGMIRILFPYQLLASEIPVFVDDDHFGFHDQKWS